MKLGKLTRDDLAQELFKIGANLGNYNFDLMYDINSIMKRDLKNRNYSDGLVKETLFLFTRNLGTHSFWANDITTETLQEQIDMYSPHNENGYQIEICFNCDRFNGVVYATVIQIH